ncbi:MAG: TadE/TadG family type IV pilus assembly protein [Aquabacterium sp.]
MKPRHPHASSRYQRGASGMEFALVFAIFFGIFYAIVSYSLVIFVNQSLTNVATEAAREAARLDPINFTSTTAFTNAIAARVRTRVITGIAGLPDKVRTKVLQSGNIAVTGPDGSGVITVRIVYPNYTDDPLVPSVGSLPFIGSVTYAPSSLVGVASIRPN